MFLDILIFIGYALLGFAMFLIPIFLISDHLGMYFGTPIIAMIYVAGLTVGVIYWKPFGLITIGVMWSAALLPIIIGWLINMRDERKDNQT